VRRARILLAGRPAEVTLAESGAVVLPGGLELAPERVTWLPAATGTIIGVALNDRGEVRKFQPMFRAAPYLEPPKTPVLFIKPRNTLNAHLRPVQCPATAEAIQPGGSLALVIGAPVPQCAQPEALARAVRAYTILNDFSLPQVSFYRPPVRAKSYDSFAPLGACLVDVDDVPHPDQLTVRTLINGQIVQQSSLADLIHPIPELLGFVNSFTGLAPGDVIAVSVPAERPKARPGDTVRVEIDGVGSLVNPIVTESDYRSMVGD
jgi:5-oxopent-3-ene-1,2,5-tricarboxylate decarboxylase/2-hydroxyhepta-2,4-diene-1,7-dioate isomerase